MTDPLKSMPQARILERRDVSANLLVLRLEPDCDFSFRPGQYCTLGIDGIERAYSIASSPHEPFLELFIEVVPGGTLTPRLRNLRPGDTVGILPRAKGVFTLETARPHQFFVATVTGVAPFISMIRHAFHEPETGHTFYLLHGASFRDEFAYREEMEALEAKHKGVFFYVPTISRPTEDRNRGWTGARRRVEGIVEEEIDRFGLQSGSTQVYACGHPGMIGAVKERMTARGFPIKEEKYWEE